MKITDKMKDKIWVFNGENSKLPSAIFSSKQNAISWIEKNKVSGLLTGYPIDISVYDWAISESYFKTKKPEHFTSKFIESFTSAYLEHFHFENGESY